MLFVVPPPATLIALVLLSAGCDCGASPPPRFTSQEAPEPPAPVDDMPSDPAPPAAPVFAASVVAFLHANPDVLSISSHPIGGPRDTEATFGVIRRASETDLCITLEADGAAPDVRCIRDPRDLRYFEGTGIPGVTEAVSLNGPSERWALPLVDAAAPERVRFEEVTVPSGERRLLGGARPGRHDDGYPFPAYRNPTLRQSHMAASPLGPATTVAPPPFEVLRPHPEITQLDRAFAIVSEVRDADGTTSGVLVSRSTTADDIEARFGSRHDGVWRFSPPFRIGNLDPQQFAQTFASIEAAPEGGPGAVALRYFRITGGSHDWDAIQDRCLFLVDGDTLTVGPTLTVQHLGYVEVPPPHPYPWVGVLTEVEASADCVVVRPTRTFQVLFRNDDTYGVRGVRPWRGALPEGFVDLGAFERVGAGYRPSSCSP